MSTETISRLALFAALFASVAWFTGCEDACGNGTVEDDETCDDGNTRNGDGCSKQCRLEDAVDVDGGGILPPSDGGAAPDAADAEPGETDAESPEADAAPTEPDAEPVELEDLALNSVIPNRGPIAGGTSIRIIGAGFVEGVQFRFGVDLIQCQEVEVESPNHARCVTPEGMVGPVDILAIHQFDGVDGPQRQQALLQNGFTYFEPVTLEAVQPDRSPLRGGIPLRLQGTGLIDGTRVSVGGRPAAEVELQQDGSLLALAPPGLPGPADVSVNNFNGQATLPDALFYFEELLVEDIDPPVGPVQGGVRAQVTGTGLLRDTRVSFAENAAEVQGAGDDHLSLELVVPRGEGPGAVDVRFANDNGELVLRNGFVYYDEDAVDLAVVGLAPPAGPVEGGNTVFVAGAGFTRDTEVSIGGRPTPCEFVDSHVLRCVAPPGEVGPADVQVEDGGEQVVVPDGYAWFETLDLIAIVPDRGSIAGGTIVSLTGTGFRDDMEVTLGGLPLLELEVLDETRANGKTPPNNPGPVDVVVTTEFSRASIPGGFNYFDPINRFGGVWGEPIEGAVNVTVLNSGSGAPVDEAAVLLISEDGLTTIEGLTDGQGQVTLSQPGLEGPVNITAAKEGFEVTTIEDVEAENITIYLLPNDGMGAPPPGVPAAILRGTATGLDDLPKPVNERYINVIVIETTHSSPYNRNRLPPPGPSGMLFEDGPFEIIARPGELAIVATAGELDRDALKDYQDGLIGYWEMRQQLNPLAMGLRRFISASPGEEYDDLDVDIDHPMDLAIPIDLDNPPAGPEPGPQFYAILPRLDLGAEGYWEIDTQAVALDPGLRLTTMPSLEGWDNDITYYLIALAFSATDDNTPMSVTIEQTRDVDAGVFITPFVGSPFFISPDPGGALGLDRIVTWGVHDGFDGPIRAPSANMVTIEEPALGPPKPLWRYVTPSLVTEFEVPVLPEGAGAAGLGGGLMFLNIFPFIVDGDFDFDDFTYDDLGQFRWKSWGVASTTFRQ